MHTALVTACQDIRHRPWSRKAAWKKWLGREEVAEQRRSWLTIHLSCRWAAYRGRILKIYRPPRGGWPPETMHGPVNRRRLTIIWSFNREGGSAFHNENVILFLKKKWTSFFTEVPDHPRSAAIKLFQSKTKFSMIPNYKLLCPWNLLTNTLALVEEKENCWVSFRGHRLCGLPFARFAAPVLGSFACWRHSDDRDTVLFLFAVKCTPDNGDKSWPTNKESLFSWTSSMYGEADRYPMERRRIGEATRGRRWFLEKGREQSCVWEVSLSRGRVKWITEDIDSIPDRIEQVWKIKGTVFVVGVLWSHWWFIKVLN